MTNSTTPMSRLFNDVVDFYCIGDYSSVINRVPGSIGLFDARITVPKDIAANAIVSLDTMVNKAANLCGKPYPGMGVEEGIEILRLAVDGAYDLSLNLLGRTRFDVSEEGLTFRMYADSLLTLHGLRQSLNLGYY